MTIKFEATKLQMLKLLEYQADGVVILRAVALGIPEKKHQ